MKITAWIQCSKCGTQEDIGEIETPLSRLILVVEELPAGWVGSRDGKPLCPTCKAVD